MSRMTLLKIIDDTDRDSIDRTSLTASETSPDRAHEWQGIETAPRDGTSVLGCEVGREAYQVEICRFIQGRWRYAGLSREIDLTLWLPMLAQPMMELPAPRSSIIG